MRTLSRPMFNMGGPIKQGIMHGIREPYRGGSRVGAGLVGDPIFPRTGGRSHHAIQAAALLWPALARIVGGQAIKKAGQKAVGSVAQGEMAKKGIAESIKRAAGTGTGTATGIAAAAPTGFKGYLMRDPAVKAALWAKDAIFNPTTAGWGKSLARGVVSPSSLLLMGGTGLYHGLKDKPETPVTGVEKPGGFPGAVVEEKAVLSQSQKDAFAKAEREKRVNKYLDLMGYDRSKKMAIADALIDASKIVGERGTLDPKNITQELINPVIQATSKRLDKPQQIREAVGLMMTKAGLEKEMYEAKPGTVLKNVQDMVKSGQYTEKEAWAIATKEPRGPSEVITNAMAARRGSLSGPDLAIIMRDYGATHDVPVGVMTQADIVNEYGEGLKEYPSAMEIITKQKITDDGIYVIGKEVIQITGGKPLQLA